MPAPGLNKLNLYNSVVILPSLFSIINRYSVATLMSFLWSLFIDLLMKFFKRKLEVISNEADYPITVKITAWKLSRHITRTNFHNKIKQLHLLCFQKLLTAQSKSCRHEHIFKAEINKCNTSKPVIFFFRNYHIH